ncbi:hypothetical protein [Saliphagus infecundisoli]|uniref:Uncharacterized protein n=1 Tax=Saliphagus infecundisoli TaxID=1849069 RepID=A0ABD5QI57_9EURY|nr:hypothetical protein [Saliphagus infecundisoli]
MGDNEYSPERVAHELEAIVTDLRELEGHLPAPLTLTTTQRELATTAAVCRRLESPPRTTTSNSETDPRTRPDPGDEPPGFQ